MTEKGNITYSNMTKGFHDDAVSASYFAVADVELHSESDMYNTYSENNISVIMNKATNVTGTSGGFF